MPDVEQVNYSGAFFERPAIQVARDLIGAKLVRRMGTQRSSATITETEAYEGVQCGHGRNMRCLRRTDPGS